MLPYAHCINFKFSRNDTVTYRIKYACLDIDIGNEVNDDNDDDDDTLYIDVDEDVQQ